MKFEEFTETWGKDGKSLLLYLETRIVDHRGMVDQRHMNDDDRKIAVEMAKSGLLTTYCRLPAHYIMEHKDLHSTHFVEFSANAWELAHQFRKARGVVGTEATKKMTVESYEKEMKGVCQ